MPRWFLKGHLLVPFGCPKWDIKKISVANVMTTGTTITSQTPLAYIDKTSEMPLTLMSIRDVVPQDLPFDVEDDVIAVEFIRDLLKNNAEIATDFERRFLDLYFEALKHSVEDWSWEEQTPREQRPAPRNNKKWIFHGLLPLPQAHLYLLDPLSKTGGAYKPERMVKVDFAFWTGKRFVAVEIDGESHVGSVDHVTKDRLLQRAGVTVIHILNQELVEHGKEAVTKLLPDDVMQYWKLMKKQPQHWYNPLEFPF